MYTNMYNCPSCGYCSHCGRGRYNPYQYYPPYQLPSYPYQSPWTVTSGIGLQQGSQNMQNQTAQTLGLSYGN